MNIMLEPDLRMLVNDRNNVLLATAVELLKENSQMIFVFKSSNRLPKSRYHGR